jgi:Protein of unknown function (DUF3300)
MKLFHQRVAAILCGCLTFAGLVNGFASTTAMPASQPAPEAVQQSPEQLRELAAPIALYPDPLIGQILAAATYPSQLLKADDWMQQHRGLTGDALAKEVDKQPWDPSVKALTEFPAVLTNMSQNLAWTSELGDAYVNQSQELTKTIQDLRVLAKNAGNLTSTSQQNVTTDGDAIDIEPTSTDEVYVPQYDPWDVYGDSLPIFPGWDPYPGLYLYSPGIAFGLGFGIGWFGGYGWGWNHWGCDWHHGQVMYDQHAFVSHSRATVDRGGAHSIGHDFHSGLAGHAASRVGGHAASRIGHSFHSASRTSHSFHSARSFSAFRGHSGAHAFFNSGGFHGSHGGGFHGGGFHGEGFHGGGHGGHR